MKQKMALMIILLTGHTVIKPWYGHAIVGAYDKKINKWSILLAKDLGTTNWSDFKEQPQGQEDVPTIALRALAKQTNNVFDPKTIKPSSQFSLDITTGDAYNFIEVPFIPGKTLYQKARTLAKDDFAWISEDNFLAPPILHPTKKTPLAVDPRLIGIIRDLIQSIRQQTAAIPDPDSWNDIPNAIYFYDKNDPYYEFTNFFVAPITLGGTVWPTTEQYFQAQKFPSDPALQEQIRNLKSIPGGQSAGSQAFSIAQKNKNKVRPDWLSGNVNVSTMLDAVRAKFTQNDGLKNLLLNTGNRILVEDARAKDAFWGNGADGKGTNHLGQMLMRIRDELRGNALPTDPYVSQKPIYYVTKYSQQPPIVPPVDSAISLAQLNELTVTLSSLQRLIK